MISCLLIHTARNPDSSPLSRESRLLGATLRIGRDSRCEIHLADPRVSLIHATVQRNAEGVPCIQAEENQTMRVQGELAEHALLSPGTALDIGPCRLHVEPNTAGHDLVLSVEMPQPDPDLTKGRDTPPFTLAALRLSKRKAGLLLALGILLLFFLLPVLPGLLQTSNTWLSGISATLTATWNPRPLSGGHALFGAKCSTCHPRPFQPVADETCLECHRQMLVHLANDKLQTSLFKELRCTHCHLDHKGKEGLLSSGAKQCVMCHGQIETVHAKSSLSDIHDFDTDHPPFRITLPHKTGLLRVKQEEMPHHQAEQGLKMSHKIHLDKKGVSSPLGNVVMACTDCHKLAESGRHFQPMTMKESCQQSRCHKMFFDEPVEGKVPHGSVRDLMQTAREFYLQWLTNPSLDLARVCGPGEESAAAPLRHTLDCANRLAKKNISVFFKKKLNCDMCHVTEPTDQPDIPWKIAPLRIQRDWQPGAIFPHSRHNTLACTECHDKSNAKTSADIAMPDIAKCRTCHVGDRTVVDKIRTGCRQCHLFHWKPTPPKT
ncbi:MAG: FHA domain-containing protein [Magnetococcales bacterium]|nr:cytochrome c3 family protein [Magnetococcales bacterium]NGZ05078.1 FHA domain-containing protein [Magnetococcales bacterium]